MMVAASCKGEQEKYKTQQDKFQMNEKRYAAPILQEQEIETETETIGK